MSLAVLTELNGEIKRLTAAGSTLAYEDFGLKKLLPKLNKLGEASPVFLKLSKMTEDLVSRNENSEEKLLELITLLNAVMYTQGDWEVKGDIEELELIKNNCTTELGYRKLSPIIEALITTGPGRYSLIKDAFEGGVFGKRDKRLIYPIIKGLEDSYAETAEFIIQNIIPVYGAMMIPVLKASIDMAGGRSDGRKLRSIHKLAGKSELELYRKALDEGSVEVKLSAIEILNEEKAPNSVFEELATSKRKEIREAAEAVLESRKTGILDKLTRIFGIR